LKIELQSPYKEKWKYGYLVTNKENRKHVVLYNSDSDRTTTSYARYLMTVHLGKEIPKGYEVDHIDHDKTNDVLSNLQVLSSLENKEKENLRKPFEIKHGTLSGYRYCKCLECKKANQDWNKQYYLTRKKKQIHFTTLGV
jgi:hypothetical protein